MVEKTNFPINPEVAAVFESYLEPYRGKLLFLRELIFGTAEALGDVGPIEETLKWGEASYLTPKTKSGSTIRIAWKEAHPEQYSIFFKCTANLVPAFKEKFPHQFNYDKNRRIGFTLDDDVPVAALKQCIGLALTYHWNKKLETAARWEIVEKVR
jgi:hypothetical protein